MPPETRDLYAFAFVGNEKTKDKVINDLTKFKKETQKLEETRVTYQEVYKQKQQQTKDMVKLAGGKVANRKLVAKLKQKSAKEEAKTKKASSTKKTTAKTAKKNDKDDIDIPPSAKDKLLKNRAEAKVLLETKRKRRRKAVKSDDEDEETKDAPLDTPKKRAATLTADKIVANIASTGTRSRGPITPKKHGKENVTPAKKGTQMGTPQPRKLIIKV